MGEILKNGPWAGFEVISTYTREEAIEDGVIVDLSTNYPNDTRMFKWPVYCTDTVWSLIDSAAMADNVEAGVYVWDVCNMAAMTIVANGKNDGSEVFFKVCLPLRCNRKETNLKLVCGPLGPDNPRPCMTIMLPNED
jgi:hypothetical protein